MSGTQQPQSSLLGALFLGGVPFLMGAATLYFTSGVTFRCEGPTPGQITCREGRRLFKLFDVPVRRYVDVRGAVTEQRVAHDADGNRYERSVTVLVTGGGRAGLLPAGEGVGFDALAERVESYAKRPTSEGLMMAQDPGYLFFFIHLFASIFVCAGLWTFGSYVWHVASRFPRLASVESPPVPPE